MRKFLFWLLVIPSIFPFTTLAQIQIGTLSGVVLDSTGAILADARVVLENPLTGFERQTASDSRGAFAFNNVPFAQYNLRVEAAGFQAATQQLAVRSNLPVTVEVRLSAAGAKEAVSVTESDRLIDKGSSSTEHKLEENFVAHFPTTNRNRQLQSIVATLPGWNTENDGLMHIRGVDDGILYVIDGIPTVDRLDALFASAPDTEMTHSVEVITGNVPAEFGGRSGAVVTLQPKSGFDAGWWGSLNLGYSSFNTKDISIAVGGSVGMKLGLFFSASGNRSNRFLDPVDERNFNNLGGAVKFNFRSDYHPTSKDILLFNVSTNGTDLHVTNALEQELAGQRQREELRDNSESVTWQHIWSANTVMNVAGFHRYLEADLRPGQFDTPLTAGQERRHSRLGFIANLTHAVKNHTFKFGVEASRVTPHEFFTFAVTNEDEAEDDLSDAALAFDIDNPFVFREKATGHQEALFAQDNFSPLKNLTINAGVRFDHYSLKVSDSMVSPRAGAVYYIPKTRTAIRASYNRIFMPPQIENLLLADSAQARALSPFADENGGGTLIRPERTSSYEVGFAQDVRGWFKLDAACWYRNFHNFADPNVFFNTTIIFPNSVNKGFARGVDVRLDIPRRYGWSGYVSYSNSRVLQTGPINGGLFLEDDFIETGPGVKFIPDHDQRNVAAFGLIYEYRRVWASFAGRHESGTPLEVDEGDLDELMETRGADLVDFNRLRVKPYTVFNFAAGVRVLNTDQLSMDLHFDVQNIFDKRFAYNFGNPFSGTHFGNPRLIGGGVKFTFR
jgi:outer membrane receptor protein involved in Fe transport